MTWIQPIYDRTLEDIKIAKETLSRWINENSDLSNITYLKGCFTISDLNRIEGNIKYLSEKLSEYLFKIDVETKYWTESDEFNTNDVKRIVTNIEIIIYGFYQQSKAEKLPDTITHFTHVNAIEQNLLLIKELLDGMKNATSLAGTFKAGAKRELPIRR